jgi:hypothetical protein
MHWSGFETGNVAGDPCNAAAGAHRHPERANAQGSLPHHAAPAQLGTPALVLHASTVSRMPTRATPASMRRILVPDRSEMLRWPSLGWLQRANVHAPAARTRSRQFCCGDAIRKRYVDPVRAACANFEVPSVGSRRTPAHGPPRRRYISSQGNQQTAAQSTSSAVEAPRHSGLFLGANSPNRDAVEVDSIDMSTSSEAKDHTSPVNGKQQAF